MMEELKPCDFSFDQFNFNGLVMVFYKSNKQHLVLKRKVYFGERLEMKGQIESTFNQ